MKIRNINEAIAILQRYVPAVSRFSGDNMSLDRMWPLLALVGNPQEQLTVVHIAGTSGKTSTSYYVAALLHSAGKKVGLTVSPHVDSITERIQIDGMPISEQLFCDELSKFLELTKTTTVSPSYFELLVAFELWFFVKHKVEFAVVETGMGGLLDATNVITNPSKVCVITDIGLDHMHILGNTIPEIAMQKAGIIQEKNHVFLYDQGEEIMGPLNKRIHEKQAIVHQVNYISNFYTDLPLFQQKNFQLALEAFLYLSKKYNLASKQIDPISVVVPARMETTVREDGSILIMDGAHNGQKVASFVESYKVMYPNIKATILLALKAGKEFQDVLDALEPIANSFIFTTFNSSQDLPAIAQDATTLADYMRERYTLPVSVISDPVEAYNVLQQSGDHMKLVIGSFYLIGQIRNMSEA